MRNLPRGWANMTLAEVGRWGSGGTPKASVPSYYGGTIPWIRSGDLPDAHIVKHEITLTDSGIENSAAKWVSSGAVLIAMYGATIGKLGITTYPVTTNQAIAFIEPSSGVDTHYLFENLRFRKPDLVALGQGGAQPNVSQEILKAQAFPLAPLPEQRRIVAKIDSLTGKSRRARDHLDHIPRLVEKYKQAILAEAFRGDWPSIQIGSIIREVVAGKNLRCEERPPSHHERGVVKVSAVSWGAFNAQASKTLPVSFTPPTSTQIKGGDLLISRANTLELVGAVVIVAETPSNLFLSDKVLRLDVVDEDKPWLMWFLRSPEGRAAIEAGATGNQLSMRNLSQSALKGIEMPWPNAEQRQEIVRRIESAFAWIGRLASDATSARKLIDHLDQAVLSKAFKGELVPQDPADEPGSALLERIRAERAAAPKARRGPKKAA